MLHENILVSVCVHDISPAAWGTETLQMLACSLAEAFRYWEILVAVPSDVSADWYTGFQSTPNVRLLRLRPGLDSYGVRVALATEAIGDVVAIASAEEIGFLDIRQMVLDANLSNELVIGDRGKGAALDTLLALAGNSSGFHVNARFMQTMACPRALLTRLLNQPERQLALRFPPKDHAIPLRVVSASHEFSRQTRRRNLAGRIVLAQRLMVSSAPRVLMMLSVVSSLVVLGGGLFLAYVIAIWTFKDAVQPGWVTTSSILAVSAALLGLLGLGLSTGVQKIIDLLLREESDDVLEEIGNVNVYSGIAEDLNVHYESGGGPGVSVLVGGVVNGRD